MKGIIILLFIGLFFSLSANEKTAIEIFSNDPGKNIHFLNLNLSLEVQYQFTSDPDDSSSYVPLSLNVMYHYRPQSLVGAFSQFNYGFLSINSGQTPFQLFDISLEGGALFQLYNSLDIEHPKIILKSPGNSRTFVTLPMKTRNVLSIRCGAMANINNYHYYINAIDIAQGAAYSNFQIFIGMSFWKVYDSVIKILDDRYTKKFGEFHLDKFHFDLYGDLLLSLADWKIGGRVGINLSFLAEITSLFEIGYIPHKGMTLKMAIGHNFTFPQKN